ncbi:MAG: PIN domain-containing protein [Armatimonadota bacterium]|nr:PIN domain-containing protein [Armatimonadota bacterium]
MKYVVDTHALIWFLGDSSRLGADCDAVLSDPDSELILPATALAEALWIVERGRIPSLSIPDLLSAVDADPRIILFPLDRAVLDASLPLTAIAEMHDRHIVATALLLAASGESIAVLTKDDMIRHSGLVTCIW